MQKLYPLARPLLFALDPETAHAVAFAALDAAARLGLAKRASPRLAGAPFKVMGIDFPNRVGLAAGLDKNAQHLAGLSTLGFGFLEAGTVTPRAQAGNPKPRMFRLTGARALINRLGFNNDGIARFVANVAASGYGGVLGINIGKNFDTPNNRAADDYLVCLRAVYLHAHYVAVNISSPNTAGLRELQAGDALAPLLAALKREQTILSAQHGRYVPIVIKIAPDLTDVAVRRIAKLLVRSGMDGVIATNTTIAREAVAGQRHAAEAGGLSGAPVRARSTAVVRVLARALDGAIPVVGVGGIMNGEDALEKIEAGASLVQIYTGLIYRGPGIVAECVSTLSNADAKRKI